jgi:hypothetical protein
VKDIDFDIEMTMIEREIKLTCSRDDIINKKNRIKDNTTQTKQET